MVPVRAPFGDPRSDPRADPRRDAGQPGTGVLPSPAPHLQLRTLPDDARYDRPSLGSPPEAVLPSPATRAR